MRTGACTVQQTLTSEAASVLKHSLSLARRRGHAQVTPLHVAATLLSPRASLLKRACLKSQPHQASHPLQSRALELCFNVALNRLPTTPTPLLHGQPCLSNALIAALKRAQAHQRRGCIEQQQQQQQQPLLAIKVELEQLTLSILDDPSVSRVMREAGFSSTAVKNNLEDFSSATSVFQCYATSGGVYSSPSSPSPPENPNSFWKSHFLNYNSDPNPFLFSPQKKLPLSNTLTDSASVKEDIRLVFEVLLRKKRRNTVIVGDSVPVTEGLVTELMDRVEKRDVPDELKSAHIIKFQFSSVPLRFMKREEVELNLSDLKRKVDSLALGGGGVIIYTGDLKWTVDTAVSDREVICGYNPVDHLVADIGRLLYEYSNTNTQVWLLATASYQTYMRCQMKQPSLEIQWSLQAVSVPSSGLGLSLHSTSVHDNRITFSQTPHLVLETKPFSGKEEQEKLTCCAECTSKYEEEAASIKSSQQKPSLYVRSCSTKDMGKDSTALPYWLQSHATEMQKDDFGELRRKWNRLCQSQHQSRDIQNHAGSLLVNNQILAGSNYAHASAYPCWPNRNNIPDSNSNSFSHSTLKPSHTASSQARFRRQQSCHIEFSFSNGNHKKQSVEPSLDSLKNTDGKEVKITLALGNSQFSDSRNLVERTSDICKQLQENLPWQLQTIPSIVEALVQSKQAKETWLLIQGNDSIGKRRLARAIAESVFGSADLLLQVNMRERTDNTTTLCGTLERALRDHEKLVVLVEDVDCAEAQFLEFLCHGFESGTFELSRKEGSSAETIFILTKGDSTSYGDVKYLNSAIQIQLEVIETIPNPETPESNNKRKAEQDLSNKAKSPKIDVKKNACAFVTKTGNSQKEFTRQPSSNTLDLNMKADEDEDENEAKAGNLSPDSSDLTRESGNDLQSPHAFLDLIENRFVFNRHSTHDSLIKEMLSSKIKGSFEEVCGSGGGHLGFLFGGVEEKLLEEFLLRSGSFLNSLFEKWLREVFQKSLQTVKIGGKEAYLSTIRLCLGRKGEPGLEKNGFMGSILPKRVQVSFMA